MNDKELEQLLREEMDDGQNVADSVGSWIVMFALVVLIVGLLAIGVSSVFAAELEPQARVLMTTLQAVSR